MADTAEGRFAKMFSAAMRERGITLKELAAKSDYQYEAFRKLARGMTTPSRDMLHYLHSALGMDIKKAELAATEDRARRRGMWKVVAQAAGKNPELDPIEQVWHELSEHDKRELIELARMKARFNQEKVQQRRRTG